MKDKINNQTVLSHFLIAYRPGQSNWECTMWKFQDYYATQILREINFGHFQAPKTVGCAVLYSDVPKV